MESMVPEVPQHRTIDFAKGYRPNAPLTEYVWGG